MRRRFVTVDVFAEQQFSGNPLAVVLDAEGLSSATMQRVAAEFNYAETTFVLPPRSADHTAHVRIFTPRSEVPFAGHPNVGTAFVIARRTTGDVAPARLQLEEGAGIVPVDLLVENDRIVGAELTAPERLSQHSSVSPAAVANCLSLDERDIRLDVHRPVVISVGLPFVVVELQDRATLRRAVSDLKAVAATLPIDGADAIYLYTRHRAPGDPPADIVARMFAPLDGIAEDPATGSATAALTGLLAQLATAGDQELVLDFAQGVDLGRPSALRARARKRGGVVDLVRVGGRCVEVMEGSLDLVEGR